MKRIINVFIYIYKEYGLVVLLWRIILTPFIFIILFFEEFWNWWHFKISQKLLRISENEFLDDIINFFNKENK